MLGKVKGKIVPPRKLMVLEQYISALKATYPDFQFKYDEDFFNKCGES